jgi:hypothetical protein
MANIGKVVVRPFNRTTISAPNFQPEINVSINSIQSLNVEVKTDRDVILYNAETGEYISSPLNQAQVDITNINGGNF